METWSCLAFAVWLLGEYPRLIWSSYLLSIYSTFVTCFSSYFSPLGTGGVRASEQPSDSNMETLRCTSIESGGEIMDQLTHLKQSLEAAGAASDEIPENQYAVGWLQVQCVAVNASQRSTWLTLVCTTWTDAGQEDEPIRGWHQGAMSQSCQWTTENRLPCCSMSSNRQH